MTWLKENYKWVVIALLLVLILGFVAFPYLEDGWDDVDLSEDDATLSAQGIPKTRVTWLIAKKLTVLNDASLQGDLSFSGADVDLNGNDLIIDTDGDSILDENTDDNTRLTLGAAAGTHSILTGNLKVGDGSPTTAQDGEDAYFEGNTETDGTARLDGVLDANANIDQDGTSDTVQLAVTGYTTQTSDLATFDGGLVDIGGGSYATADGDNDLGVAGDLEVTGAVDANGTMNVAGATTLGADITVSNDSTGGNANARNEIIGLPRITIVDLAQGTNPGSETVDCMDATPTGEWAEVDAGSNLAVTADTTYYRYDTNSILMTVITPTNNDGLDCTIPAQDDLSGLESIGFWMYSDEAITAGDLDLTVDDSDGTDQVYTTTITCSANIWTWIEVDISGCDANCDTTDGFFILFTAQGATNLTDPNIYIDELFYWDSADEEALGQAIVDNGVISIISTPTLSSTNNTLSVAAEYTDYITHYESGSDFVVWITDQSANEVLALIAY